MIQDQKLDFWIKNNYNILITGRHGVGKTSIIIDAFKRNGLKWMYFSAATMDPWVDFIGVPKEKQVGDQTYLELVRPQQFQDDQVEALFFDEYNRAPKKVRNAVMELIQFKSINGKKFNNLKIVWAAVNPEDDDAEDRDGTKQLKYDVEALDPAQKDRFHIHVEIPYKCHPPYFKEKYGEMQASAAIGWWNDLNNEIKDSLSPRRLDYALDVYKNGGDLRDVLPQKSNISKLINEISNGSIKKRLKDVFSSDDVEKAKELISDVNIWGFVTDQIASKSDYLEFFFPIMDKEKQVKMIISEPKVLNYCIENKDKYEEVLQSILEANLNPKVSKKIKAVLPKKIKVRELFTSTITPKDFQIKLDNWTDQVKKGVWGVSSTVNRANAFLILRDLVPKVLDTESSLKILSTIDKNIISKTQMKSLENGPKIGLYWDKKNRSKSGHHYSDLPLLLKHIFDTLHNDLSYKNSYVSFNPSPNFQKYLRKYKNIINSKFLDSLV